MSRLTLPLLALAIFACPTRRGGDPPGGGPVDVRSPWENWVIFDQPETGLQLGDAWNLSGQVDRGCYVVARDSAEQRSSWKNYELTWSDSTNMALRVSVATAFGFGGSVRAAQKGSIRFHNLVIRRAVNTGPAGPGQCASSVNGVPSKPAIIALIGADSLDFNLSQSLDAQAETELKANARGGKASVERSADRGVIARFDSHRLVGAQFLGLSHSANIDSARTMIPVGSYRSVKWDFEATAQRMQDGRYRIIVQRTIPPATADTAEVDEGRTFFFGIPRSGILRGEFFAARYYRNAAGDHLRLLAQRRRYEEVPLVRREDRDAVLNWGKPKP